MSPPGVKRKRSLAILNALDLVVDRPDDLTGLVMTFDGGARGEITGVT